MYISVCVHVNKLLHTADVHADMICDRMVPNDPWQVSVASVVDNVTADRCHHHHHHGFIVRLLRS